MTNCFPPTPINPINDALMSIFGNNFFPPFNAGFQPTDKLSLVNEKLLQFQIPGGGKLKPIGDPHKSLSEILAPMTGALGSVFAFFGPLFIILDLIRAIIDILCALFNPGPMIAALVDMFLTVVPPVIALFPPLSSILLALNIIKLIIALVVSMTTAIVAIIDLIVENALQIADLISDGNIAAVEAVTTKICTLLESFTNQLACFAPISFILQIIDIFMSLGSKFFCATDAACCNNENCPPIIMTPPSGSTTVSSTRVSITLKDLVSPINPLQLPTILDPPITIPLDTITLGVIPDLNIGPISFPELDLVPLNDDDLDAFVLVEPEMVLDISGVDNLDTLGDFIVDPKKIPGSSNDPDAATIRVRLTDSSGTTVLARATAATATTVSVRADDFAAGTTLTYSIEPDKTALIKLNLIGLGCDDDVRAAAAGVRTRIDETSVGIAVVSGGTGRSGFEPLIDKMGRNIPRPPDYGACLAAQQADPTVSQAQCVADISSAYLDDLKDFGLDLVCLGASRTASEFEVSKAYVIADSSDAATITLTVNDASGANLLANFFTNADSSSDFTAQFSSSLGLVGPVSFDAANGFFHATLSSDEPGVAIISAAFLIKGNVCMIPATTDGFALTDKTQTVSFQRAGGAFPRRRPEDQYVQSAGGRRRR